MLQQLDEVWVLGALGSWCYGRVLNNRTYAMLILEKANARTV